MKSIYWWYIKKEIEQELEEVFKKAKLGKKRRLKLISKIEDYANDYSREAVSDYAAGEAV
jgi:hypothetical protein